MNKKDTEYYPNDPEIERQRKLRVYQREFYILPKKVKLTDIKFYCPYYLAAII